jgi:hypothetical protein
MHCRDNLTSSVQTVRLKVKGLVADGWAELSQMLLAKEWKVKTLGTPALSMT